MALAVAENEAADPVNVRPLGADAAVVDPDPRTHPIEQSRTPARDNPYLDLAFVAYRESTEPAYRHPVWLDNSPQVSYVLTPFLGST